MLCDLLRKYASPELVRRTKLELTNGRVMLPEGFLGAVGAEDDNGCPLFANYEAKEIPRKHYRIEGDYLIAGEEKVNLVYHKRPIGADDIDLPAGMVNYLGKGCANLLNGEYDAATAAFENAVKLYGGDKRGAIDDLPMWGG